MATNTLDIKKISVYNFVEILNTQGIIKQYFNNTSDVEVEYFNENEESKLLNSKNFKKLQNTISQKFSGK
ncbi:hypothetical protein M0P65_00995 [Candidatus Gracilibacteria bacterium]|nr:hypothetical protein [Candidatus Gracilibacteria bacterium]